MLVEEIGALRDFVLYNLYMGRPRRALRDGFWMCSIVDIRIGALLLAWSMARHAWILHGFSHNEPLWQIAEGRDTPRPIAVGSENLPKRPLS
jgi:hypothetical protein